jgi:sirohydrochlorin ferrochelatase
MNRPGCPPTPSSSRPRIGLLICAHGTRSERGVAEVLQTSRATARQLSNVPTAVGFLEYAKPSVSAAVQRLVTDNVREMVMVPLFLFTANHMKQDIPSALEAAVRPFPHVRAIMLPALSEHPYITRLSVNRLETALNKANLSPSETALLLVGRGGQDRHAVEDFRRFAALRARLVVDQDHVAELIPALLAGSHLPLNEAVKAASATPWRGVAVQPHLLFQGRLTERLSRLVREQDLAAPRQQWLMVDHLGHDAALAPLVAQLFRLGKQRILEEDQSQQQVWQVGRGIYPLAI